MAVAPEKQEKKRVFWFGAVAAAIALVVGVVFTFSMVEESHFVEKLALQKEEVEAHAMGELLLSDGSKVWINSNSNLYYPKSFSEKRVVYLEGEAYFEIAKDENKPFIIHTQKGTTEVLGTSFNISSTKNEVVVTVTEGLVALYPEENPEKKVVLKRGEKGLYYPGHDEVSKSANTDRNVLSWKTGTLIFEDAALNAVTEALSRHFQQDVVAAKDVSETCRLTSTFKGKNLEEVLELLKLTLDVEVEKEDNRVLIRKGGC